MIGPFGRAQIFISYAREDAALASRLQGELERRGFSVFVDREGTLVGENFVRRIVSELRRADAVVALLTPASAASEWCRAELYHAHALGREILPIRLEGGTFALSEPLELMHRGIHRLEAEDDNAIAALFVRLADQLRDVRRRRVLRNVAAGIVIGAAVIGIAALALGAARRIEAIAKGRARDRALADVRASSQPFPESRIGSLSEGLLGDRQLVASALVMGEDTSLADGARFNAQLLALHAATPLHASGRWRIEKIAWDDGAVAGARWSDVIFATGDIDRLHVTRSSLSAIYWGTGYNGADRWDLSLADSTFVHSDLFGNYFDGVKVIGTTFENCKIRGSRIDVTGFQDTRFIQRDAAPRAVGEITDEFALIENSVVVNRIEAPAPGTIEMGDPASEVEFVNVWFDSTHFRGRIRPEWFRNCTFRRCVLPATLLEADLLSRGNKIEDCIFRTELID